MGAIDELSTRRLKHFPQRVGDTLFRRWRRDDMWSCSRLIYNILNVRLEDEQKVSSSMLSPIYKIQSEGFSSQIMHAGRESGLKSETKNHSKTRKRPSDWYLWERRRSWAYFPFQRSFIDLIGRLNSELTSVFCLLLESKICIVLQILFIFIV